MNDSDDFEASKPFDSLSESERQDSDLAAIRAGIADMEAGRYRPLTEVDVELRAKHGIPASENKQVKK